MSSKKAQTTTKSDPKSKKINATTPAGTVPTGNTTAASASPAAATSPQVTVPATRARSRAKTQVINVITALIAGLQANFSSTDTFILPGGTFTVAELVAALSAYLVLISNVTAATSAYHKAVNAEKAGATSALALRADIQVALQGRLGKGSPELVDYGFTPQKTRTVAPETLVAAAAKAKSTRAARGTTGSREKLGVTGNVSGVVITPVTDGSSQAATPAAPAVPAKS